MSFGSVLKSAWKAVSSPVEWMTSPLGMIVGYGMDALGNYYVQDQANKANLKLWREQAEYNKPINQIARLQEAGLNPNLIYGSGGVQNTITSAPKMESPNLPSLNLMAYQQVLNGKAQYDLLKEQIKLTKAQENNAQLKSVAQILQNNFQNLENDYKAYENKQLMDSGIIKGDTPWLRTGGRIASFLNRFVGLFNDDSRQDLKNAAHRDFERIFKKIDYSKYGGGLR